MTKIRMKRNIITIGKKSRNHNDPNIHENSNRFHVSRPREKKKANDFTNRIIQQFPLPSRFRFESLTFTRRIHF